ncbi:DUF6884 domain-containing protein [Streptomyces sp. NPDC090493]|uniref:DUF6884 domain-containing protein n=1 Tax=Streptomyces sp. NPDC090493 TaxID=3365964 RepID=UPI0038065C9F
MPLSLVLRISIVAPLRQAATAAGLSGLTGPCVLGAGPRSHRAVRRAEATRRVSRDVPAAKDAATKATAQLFAEVATAPASSAVQTTTRPARTQAPGRAPSPRTCSLTSDPQPATRTRSPTIRVLAYGFRSPAVQDSWNLRALPCSAAKLPVDRPTPARRLYTGSYHLMCRRAAERIAGPAGVLVLSARHGLVRLDDALLPYEQRMDTPGHIAVEQLHAQAAELGILAARDLIALGGRAYVDAVTAVRPDTLRPLDGCRGIGEQRSRSPSRGRRAAPPGQGPRRRPRPGGE